MPETTLYSICILPGTAEQPPATQFINRGYDMAEFEVRRKGCPQSTIKREPLYWLEPTDEFPSGGWQLLVTGVALA